MAVTVYPQIGFTYPDANNVPITSVGATVSESEYIADAIDAGYLLTWDPLEVNEPDERVDGVTDAPADALYLTLANDGTLTQERVLTAGTGISFVDTGAGGTLTINATGTGAGDVVGPVSATDERLARFDGGTGKLIQSSPVGLTDAGAMTGLTGLTVTGSITVSGTVDGVDVSALGTTVTALGTGSYLTLGSDPALANERVLTAGIGLASTDGGAGGALTLNSLRTFASQTGPYILVLADAGKSVGVALGTATTVTIPPTSSVAFPEGTEIEVVQQGLGRVTVTAGIGVSLQSAGNVTTRSIFSVLKLTKLVGDVWNVSGDVIRDLEIWSTKSGDYTFALGDANLVINRDGGGTVATTFTIPDNATVAFPLGTVIYAQLGPTAGQLTIAPAVGVTLSYPGSPSGITGALLSKPGARVTLSKKAVDTWYLAGDVAQVTFTSAVSVNLAVNHIGNVVYQTSASANNVTVQADASISYPIGAKTTIVQAGAGAVTIVGSGTTVTAPTGKSLVLSGPGAMVDLIKTGANQWYASGDLTETAQYLTLATAGNLANERVLTAGGGISLDSTVAGVLTVSSTAGVAGTQAVIATAVGGQAIPALTNTTIAFATEVYDVSNNFAANTYTVPITGLYQININVAVPVAAGAGVIYLALAGAPVTGVGFAVTFGGFEQSQYSQLRSLTAGQLVTAMVQTTNATTITTAQIDVHRVA